MSRTGWGGRSTGHRGTLAAQGPPGAPGSPWAGGRCRGGGVRAASRGHTSPTQHLGPRHSQAGGQQPTGPPSRCGGPAPQTDWAGAALQSQRREGGRGKQRGSGEAGADLEVPGPHVLSEDPGAEDRASGGWVTLPTCKSVACDLPRGLPSLTLIGPNQPQVWAGSGFGGTENGGAGRRPRRAHLRWGRAEGWGLGRWQPGTEEQMSGPRPTSISTHRKEALLPADRPPGTWPRSSAQFPGAALPLASDTPCGLQRETPAAPWGSRTCRQVALLTPGAAPLSPRGQTPMRSPRHIHEPHPTSMPTAPRSESPPRWAMAGPQCQGAGARTPFLSLWSRPQDLNGEGLGGL